MGLAEVIEFAGFVSAVCVAAPARMLRMDPFRVLRAVSDPHSTAMLQGILQQEWLCQNYRYIRRHDRELWVFGGNGGKPFSPISPYGGGKP